MLIMELVIARRGRTASRPPAMHAGEGGDVGEHLHDGLHAPELLDLTELLAEFVEGEIVDFAGLSFSLPAKS